ncbi:MAG: diguanylate cyclase [Deltaproteobacteria bacterium]|nr:diguanylate cyclase [Deltaproteobacteria bacterium]
MEGERYHSRTEFTSEYVEILYRRHVQGAIVRSVASVLMWVFALVSYYEDVIRIHHLTGITLSVLYLILINPPTLLLLKHITQVRLYQYASLLINFLEIIGYTAIIYFLGGLEATYLTPIYAALITYVGAVAPRGFTYIVALMCSAAFGFVVAGNYFGLLPNQSLIQSFNPPGIIRFIHLSVVMGLLLVVAYISSLTAGILKKNRDRLREQNVELTQTAEELTDAIDRLRSEIKERKRVEKALQDSEQRYRELSIVDALTQLYNSRYFYHQLKVEIARAERYEQPVTLLMLDLDDFKKFNDAYGHVEGDEVLSRFGQVLRRCLRKMDSAYRYGGEEFTVVLPMTPTEGAAVVAERIRTEFKKETFSLSPGQDVHMMVSIGLAQYKPQEDMKAFVSRADLLMYQGKKDGKDRVCCELS